MHIVRRPAYSGPAHHEGLRERPDEVPATTHDASCPDPSGSSWEQVPNPTHARVAGTDEKEDFMSTVLDETTTTPSRTQGLREGAFGNARALACRECGHEVDLGPSYACPECFGPLEVAYDFPAVTREEIAAGPGQHLALQGAAAGAVGHRAEPQHGARLHPAAQGPQPRSRARHRQPLGQGRLHQPDQLLQGPRRRLRAERGPRARRQGLRLPLDRQPGQRRRRRRRPRRDRRRSSSSRATSSSPSRSTRPSTPTASSPSTATTTTSTSSPRRSPARRRAGRSSTSTSARSTPRAPRRSATRSPSSSAGACPTRSSSPSPPARS